MYAVLLPIVVFVLVYLRRRDVYDLHHAILGDENHGPVFIFWHLAHLDKERIGNGELLLMQVSYSPF